LIPLPAPPDGFVPPGGVLPLGENLFPYLLLLKEYYAKLFSKKKAVLK
jgi:hypothetical protein